SALATNAHTSTAYPYVGCSITPSLENRYQATSAPIMTHCFASSAGSPICASSRSTEIKSVPYAPVSHPFGERLIGTIRREYIDRAFFWNAVDLARKLHEFSDYYDAYRVHRSLDS